MKLIARTVPPSVKLDVELANSSRRRADAHLRLVSWLVSLGVLCYFFACTCWSFAFPIAYGFIVSCQRIVVQRIMYAWTACCYLIDANICEHIVFVVWNQGRSRCEFESAGNVGRRTAAGKTDLWHIRFWNSPGKVRARSLFPHWLNAQIHSCHCGELRSSLSYACSVNVVHVGGNTPA